MRNCGKVLVLSLFLCQMAIASSGWTYNILGGTDDDMVLGAGKKFDGFEAGVSAAVYNKDHSDDYDLTIGPYVAMPLDITSPMFSKEDLSTYVGVSPQMDTETWKPTLEVFGAAVVYPNRQISPVALWRYSMIDGDLQDTGSDITRGGSLFVGLRIMTK